MKRRQFLKRYSTGLIAAGLLNNINILEGFAQEQEELSDESRSPTVFIANYDTESEACLQHLEPIVNMHLKHNIPATFFIVSDILNESNRQRVVQLLDNPLFEIGSHSKGHNLILPHPLNSATGDPRVELIDSKNRLEDIFGKAIVGYATPYAYVDGFKGHQNILNIVQEAGYKYISTICWGPGFSLPAPIIEPFTYKADGFEDIWEIPKHGWHENILKGHTDATSVALLNWPSPWPEAVIPKGIIKRPEEEFEITKALLHIALEERKKHLTLAWHPWSMGRFDPQMKALDLTFGYLNKQRVKSDTFQGLYNTLVS